MTLRELCDALDGLPQRPSNTPIYVEDQQGELHELQSLEIEHLQPRPADDEGLLVLRFDPTVADV